MGFLDFFWGPSVPAISAKELNRRLKADQPPVLLDVRQPEEFRQLRISGAQLIPLRELRRRLHELPADREIACICASGLRSRAAAKMLARSGYRALNLSGGMQAWQGLNLPVQQG